MKYENNYDILDFRKPKKVYISQPFHPFLFCWQIQMWKNGDKTEFVINY